MDGSGLLPIYELTYGVDRLIFDDTTWHLEPIEKEFINLRSNHLIEQPKYVYSVDDSNPLFVISFGLEKNGTRYYKFVFRFGDFISQAGGFLFGYYCFVLMINSFLTFTKMNIKLINLATKT